MRSLTPNEILNLQELTKYSIESALIEPTVTGLRKSILDATGQVRTFLKENKIHDYELQKQGQEHKIFIKGKLITNSTVFDSNVSLYRPPTKKGDPRIWLTNLKHITYANDILALTYFSNTLYVLNISKLNINAIMNLVEVNPVKELISEISRNNNSNASELLKLLKVINARGPIPALLNADTAIGRTLESLLGININSSKLPDYKGIELKSYRSQRDNRKNLFAQVPNWNISKFKSSDQILDNFGYISGDNFQLNCTVSALSRNPNSLILRLEEKLNVLHENSSNPDIGDFVTWELSTLHKRLLEKHNETFWISADSMFMGGIEHFHYKLVEHTKKPITTQFNLLIQQGLITLDHLIKRKSGARARERGPFFKIRQKGISLLFPPSKVYKLNE